MRVRIDIKPRIVNGSSKRDIIHKVGLSGWTCDATGSRYGCYSLNNPTIKAINFEKRRKKVKILRNGERKVIHRTHWIGYVYDFTKYKGLIKKLNQNPRNFSIIFK